MKASKSIFRKALFSLMSAGSLVALSACGQPSVDHTTAPQTAATPANLPTSAPPIAQTPTTPTASKNLAELAQLASTQASFTTLTRAVQAAGLTQQMAELGPYTVFAPTNAAFAALPKGTIEKLLKPENKQQLIKLVSYHVLPGQVTSSQLTSGQVKTVEGSPVIVLVDTTTSTVIVNGAKVIQADIPASNGVVHIVDKVILPPKFPASLGSN
ncbi:fasciclin domain-containing protein [Brasilonema octagenarum]|uniref:Fasciclin domain-containing protein n=1 Tax=Brasilonema octagenarum UFV-OR1 TaxID=417115 RepID=A0ABX1M447_9CYAN|nr:fasciclin domain-containing protein [Brasilonema octagenarum]NMF62326.1 fasciclin domain-containing protein [Brasilonema octagenarum UFV-OR1]